jgi:nitrite reductase/ring-hydroxylating ferredoxin subunit
MARADELVPGKMIEKRILARRVAVVNYNGEIHAFEGDCKHMKASLCKGKIEDGVIVCPWHSWRYDLATGACLTVDKLALRKFDVEIEDGNVYVIV